MFPIFIFAALGALLAWAVKPKPTGVSGMGLGQDDANMDKLPAYNQPPPPTPGQLAAATVPKPPLAPQYERLFALLVLFARDKKFPAGFKQYLTPNTAIEAVKLARGLNLPRTALAIRSDGPLPDNEYIPGRTESIRELAYRYGTTGKA
jgi:hypothetical protein